VHHSYSLITAETLQGPKAQVHVRISSFKPYMSCTRVQVQVRIHISTENDRVPCTIITKLSPEAHEVRIRLLLFLGGNWPTTTRRPGRKCILRILGSRGASHGQWRSDGGAGRTGRHLLGAAKGRFTPKI